MKIMIVGGTGFLGNYTAQVALEHGHEVGSLSLDDIDLKGWYPEEIAVNYGDVFELSEDELVPFFEGYDAMVYSVGPDDRVYIVDAKANIVYAFDRYYKFLFKIESFITTRVFRMRSLTPPVYS